MTFTQIPQQFAPLSEEVRYTAVAEREATIEVRITDARSGALLSAKRFVKASDVSFNVAPCLRRAVKFSPIVGQTALYNPEERNVRVRIEATAIFSDGTAKTATAPERTFLTTSAPAITPALLTTMPFSRLISRGEAEELAIFTPTPRSFTVSAQTGESVTVKSFNITAGGVSYFRLNTNDFPDAESIIVDAGACGAVHYTVIAPVFGSCRLAWRSSSGSVEHYTFPIEKSVEVDSVRVRAYGSEGYLATKTEVERKSGLVSAYETRERLEALSEIIASPQVWRIEGGGYKPIDVITENCSPHRHGVIGCLEIEIRPKQKQGLPWS